MQPNRSFADWRAPLTLKKAQALDLSAERAALAVEQTKAVRLKNAVASGQFTETREMVRILEAIFHVCRENILTLPGKVSDAVALFSPGVDRAAVYRLLHAECRQILIGLSSDEAIEKSMKKKYDELTAAAGNAEDGAGADTYRDSKAGADNAEPEPNIADQFS